jgi:ribosome maturation factor RimP
MSIEDCTEVSRAVSAVLDVEDPIAGAYSLEVSSPGIDRPLVRKEDFEAAVGHLVKMETAVMVADRKRFRGKIAAAGEDGVTVERDQASYGDEPVVRVPWDAIAEARLLLTDDLVRETLKKDKQAKKMRGADEVAQDEHDNDN